MVCNSCGKEMESGSQYCPNCGAKNERANEVNSTKKCISCGIEFSGNQSYCNICGGALMKSDTLQPEKQFSQMSAINSPDNVIEKKKSISPMAIFLISFFVTIGISIIVFIAIAINGALNNRKDYANSGSLERENIISNVKTEETTKNDIVYDYKYSYAELSNVVSLDSDTRFVYSAGYTVDGAAVYTYLFNDEKATDADFLRACDDYSKVLQKLNDFAYEKEYTEQQYEKTGELTNY